MSHSIRLVRTHALAPVALALSFATALTSSAGCGDECTGICGCFDDVTLTITARVTDPSGAALEGVQLFCDEETELLATSGADGAVANSVTVGLSARCGYDRCGRLRFEDPSGAHRTRLIPFEDITSGAAVVLELSTTPELDAGVTNDGGVMEDAGATEDAGAMDDARVTDAEVADAEVVDAEVVDTDAGE